ncbi:hypothetical protein [Ensifer sp. PDNC004]|uniref:hypothetical protein n=1 Tax=Ensifer sp. PDNC004 TaxID=2811423 RepID=UPI001FEE0890|nr:hypothetical protein [Ensifer sp. PDNC004]
MSNDWFRSWHGAPTDPKWLGIARRAGVAPGIAVAVAWALMDRASQAADRGSVKGYDAEGLAYFYGCEPEQVEAIVAAMADKGMICDGRFSSWEKRQPKREDGAAERAREWRERKRTQTNAGEQDRTLDKDTDTDPSEDASAPDSKIDFENFWDAYPNKTGRPSAEKAFSQAIKRASIAEIMAGVRTYAAKTDDRQWCSPVKWLSDDRWNDKPAKPPDKPSLKPTGLGHLQPGQTREEYLAAELRRSERSFQ